MKYIDAEKLYKQVDELMAHFAELEKETKPDDEDLSIFYQGKVKMCSKLLDIINSLQQEQTEVDLEKAAKEYAKINDKSSITKGFSIVKFAAFKAGAEWMAEQGVSYETELGWEIDEDRAFPKLDPPVEGLLMPSDLSLNFNDGDKVIVQIRKAEQMKGGTNDLRTATN